MKILDFNLINKQEISKKEKVIALGKFVGFHKGHQEIFKKAKSIADNENKELVIMLYPDYDGFKNEIQKNILPFETRIKLIEQYKPSYILIFEPNEKNYALTREQFLTSLRDNLNVTDVVVGKNFSFNKNDLNDFKIIKSFFNLFTIPLKKYNGQIISTSLLELLLLEGKVENFKKLTNFNYFYEGKVIPGKLIGTKNKTPTANVKTSKSLLTPRQGIYTSYITVNKVKYYSLTSISTNPTFNQTGMHYETFILKFDENIYDKEVTVELLKYIREPKKFNTVKDLYIEIEKDKKRAKDFFKL